MNSRTVRSFFCVCLCCAPLSNARISIHFFAMLCFIFLWLIYSLTRCFANDSWCVLLYCNVCIAMSFFSTEFLFCRFFFDFFFFLSFTLIVEWKWIFVSRLTVLWWWHGKCSFFALIMTLNSGESRKQLEKPLFK